MGVALSRYIMSIDKVKGLVNEAWAEMIKVTNSTEKGKLREACFTIEKLLQDVIEGMSEVEYINRTLPKR